MKGLNRRQERMRLGMEPHNYSLLVQKVKLELASQVLAATDIKWYQLC